MSPGPRRAKESLPATVELAPVRLIGGFVCVDSHLGCAGCHFCLNRRYPAQRAVLERRLHHEWAEVGLPPEALAALVAGLPAVTRGGVPIRFGHLSDLAFEVAGAAAVLSALPATHPVMVLTRFAPSREVERLLRAHSNALLHVSVTPPVPGAIDSEVDALEVLAALREVPARQLFVMVGPLVEGSQSGVERVLAAVPPGAAVGFKPLAAEGVPFPVGVAPLSEAEVGLLAAKARALGLEVPPMAGCRLRTNLGLPFFRHRELVAQSPRACGACANQAVCASVRAPEDEVLVREAAGIGLEVQGVERLPHGVQLRVASPVARADEAYLSELLRWPVFLTGITRGGEFRVTEVDGQVLERWTRTGFFPVAEVAAVTARMVALGGLDASR
jgi:hypothetical protein